MTDTKHEALIAEIRAAVETTSSGPERDILLARLRQLENAHSKSSNKLRYPITVFTFKNSDSSKSELDVTQIEGEPSPTPEKDGEPIFVHQTSWPAIRIALYRLPNGKYQFFEQMMREPGWITDQGKVLRSPRWVTNQGYETYDTESEVRGALALFALEYEET